MESRLNDVKMTIQPTKNRIASSPMPIRPMFAEGSISLNANTTVVIEMIVRMITQKSAEPVWQAVVTFVQKLLVTSVRIQSSPAHPERPGVVGGCDVTTFPTIQAHNPILNDDE